MFALSTIRQTSGDAWPRLVSGLRTELGRDDVELLAAQFLDAEADDFRWDSRISERGLGPCQEDDGDAGTPLDRVAVLGQLAGRWYVAIACVDGEGRLWCLEGCTEFPHRMLAQKAFLALD